MAKRIGRRQVAVVVGLAMTGMMLVGACTGGASRSATDAGSAKAFQGQPRPGSAGLTSASSSDEAGAGGVAASAASPRVAGGSSASSGGAQPLPASIGEPKVIKTAAIEIEVKAKGFESAFSRVSTIAAAHGGFVGSSSSRASDDELRQAAGTLVVRVPAADFDAVRRELVGLGTLRSQQLQGTDVGGELADLDARLRNLRSQEEAMRLLMTKATTVGDTIEVQRQLGEVRQQIEQLSAQQARLGDAVALSTITVSLAEPGVAVRPVDERSPLAGAFGRAWDGTEAVLGSAIVALGYLLPLAILLGAGWLVARPVLRLRREPS